jgi:hypothetical protein
VGAASQNEKIEKSREIGQESKCRRLRTKNKPRHFGRRNKGLHSNSLQKYDVTNFL